MDILNATEIIRKNTYCSFFRTMFLFLKTRKDKLKKLTIKEIAPPNVHSS
jgi:hypothetical protein